MDAGTLRCPSCGAPALPDDVRCGYCKAALQTTICPSCFGSIFVGNEYCCHCGARASAPPSTPATGPCPRCKTAMDVRCVGGETLVECAACGGIWLDAAVFADILQKKDTQVVVAAGFGPSGAPVDDPSAEEILYLPCPRCGQLMNRVNFADCSGVIIETCRKDGTWFDREKLRKIIEFIRDGGLEKSRANEHLAAELEKKRRSITVELDASKLGAAMSYEPSRPRPTTVAGLLLRSFFHGLSGGLAPEDSDE